MRDAKQYIESLRDGREVYIHGERIEDITKHPSLRKAIDHGAIDYELDKRPELQRPPRHTLSENGKRD